MVTDRAEARISDRRGIERGGTQVFVGVDGVGSCQLGGCAFFSSPGLVPGCADGS